MSDKMYEEIYMFNNASYIITDTAEIHELLKSDPTFFEEYIKKNTSVPVLISLNELENTGQNVIEDNSFTWTTKSTKLFLEAYFERKLQFRDLKVKKKRLWQEIAQIFKMYGYTNIDEDTLDRKMRDMKRSFKTIKENNKKTSTGRGRVIWEYYDIFEKIFADNKTINPGNTLESTINVQETTNSSCHLPTETTESIENENSSILNTVSIINTNQSSSLMTPLSDITNFKNVLPETYLNSPSTSTTSTSNPNHSSTNKNRSLYNQKKTNRNRTEKNTDNL